MEMIVLSNQLSGAHLDFKVTVYGVLLLPLPRILASLPLWC